MAAEITSHESGERDLTLTRQGYFGQEEANVLLHTSGFGEIFGECGNCASTASILIQPEDLRALRDFLNEYVKDAPPESVRVSGDGFNASSISD